MSVRQVARGRRVALRTWSVEDRAALAEMNADPEVMRHFPGVLSRSESDAMAQRIAEHFAQHGFGLWVLEIGGVSSFAGFCGLSVPRFEAFFTPCVEIGWRLARNAWGNGYATEGAELALELGFRDYALEEIVAFTVPANVRSIRLMQRLGMQQDPREFEHPNLPEGHALRRHVLFRTRRPLAPVSG